MAEEKTGENQADAGNTGEADSQAAGTSDQKGADETKPADIDYEKRYKDLQAEQTRTSQENAELNRRIEQIEAERQQASDEDLDVDEEGFVDKKTVKGLIDEAVSQAIGQVRTQSANRYFRKNYPELIKYESAIAGIMRSSKKLSKLKGVSPEERIDVAVEEFNDLIKETKETATAEAEAAAKATEEAKRKASGLGASLTTPSKSDDEGISDEQELANRKARQAKKRNLA